MVEKERDIILEIEGECGPKYERIDSFLTSPLRNVYYNAFRMTEHVIEMSRKHEKGHYERLYNIISFMGERGTGKTSAMNSFTDFLKSFDEKKYQEFIVEYTGDKEAISFEDSSLTNARFMVLENIDASLLENKEDIFDVILAKMLEKIVQYMQKNIGYSQEKFHFQNMKLIQDFESICKSKRTLESNEKKYYGEGISSVELLRNLSGSMDLRESFSKLVPEFLNIMMEGFPNEICKGTDNFLVLCIDDLDLNKERGFDMLEQIHRYFMVPHVLIYLAVSESQLTDICVKHYKDVYEDSEALARAYTDKVLPFSQRIYMPVLLAKKNNIYVEKKVLGQDRLDDPNDYDIKETILWKIAHRTFVYFDGKGLKTHFYEPENIRELTNLYRILQSMKKFRLESCSIYNQIEDNRNRHFFPNNTALLENCEINYDKLLDDIYNRLASNRLNKSQLKYFQKLYGEDSSRQGERFLRYIWLKCKAEPYYAESMKKGYSFGEVLRGIYNLGRAEEKEKPMIHCFMALETVLMTRLYLRSLYHYNPDIRDKERKKLLNCLGDSVVGSWGNYLLPVLEDNAELEEGCKYNMGHMIIHSRSGGRILTLRSSSVSDWRSFLQYMESNNTLKVLELLLMCVTNWGVEYNFGPACLMSIRNASENAENNDGETDLFREDETKDAVYIEYDNQNITVDIWGFVINSARYEQYFSSLHEALLNAIEKSFGVNSQEDISQIKDEIKKNSLLEEYKEWEKIYGYAALPFYNVDMLYNIEKRVRKRCKKRYPSGTGVRKKEIYDAILDMYEAMESQLGQEDDFYKNRAENWTSLQNVYSKCPYIKYTIGHNKGILNEQLKEVFIQFIYTRAIYLSDTRDKGVDVPSEIEGY